MRRLAGLLLTLTLVGACADAAAPTAPPTVSPPGDPTSPPAASPALPPATPAAPATPAEPAATPAGSPAATFDPAAVALSFEPFASGLDALTFATHAGDGSSLLYAVEQAGVVRVVEPDGSVRSQPLLDISDRVAAGGERGLLGLAFHPDYADNGRLFVNYTDSAGDTVVAEFARIGDAIADASSERVVLTVAQPAANHNGGMVVFGPDGYLYISLGDGGGGGDPVEPGQDLGTLLGKVLRIDVDGEQPYAIPPDNPFVGRDDARPEIWAWGLRNPWRMSFDSASGALVIADVGQNEWEEINVEPAGAGGRNYGWNIMEGPECFRAETCDTTGLTMPVAWYPLGGGQCAVVGGYTYRGAAFAELDGAYLFADHCSGLVWAIQLAGALDGGRVEMAELGSAGMQPSAFAQDEAGELYLVGHGGEILRITARPR